MAGVQKSTTDKTKESRERMAKSAKNGPLMSGASTSARPMLEEDKSVKLQEQAIKIFRGKQLAAQLEAARNAGNQGLNVNSQGSLTDSQASVSEDSVVGVLRICNSFH